MIANATVGTDAVATCLVNNQIHEPIDNRHCAMKI